MKIAFVPSTFLPWIGGAEIQTHNMANKIVNGGYILVFRHAEREKWIDIQFYDAMELQNKLDADKEYFKYAVCLSDRGNIQAKMMGEYIKLLNIPIHKVISSPSCRARQTAQLAFGRIDVIKNVFLHLGPFGASSD